MEREIGVGRSTQESAGSAVDIGVRSSKVLLFPGSWHGIWGHRAAEVQPVDMFAWTEHVEAVVVLYRG